jgi:hypothetical protein
MKDKELAKRLIEEAVEKHCLAYEGLYKAKDKEKLAKDLYCKFLAELISLEDIRAELNEKKSCE